MWRNVIEATYLGFVVTGPGPTQLVAAQGANRRIAVLNYALALSAADVVEWLSAANSLGRFDLGANEPVAIGSDQEGVLVTNANEALNLSVAGGQNTASGHLVYKVQEWL